MLIAIQMMVILTRFHNLRMENINCMYLISFLFKLCSLENEDNVNWCSEEKQKGPRKGDMSVFVLCILQFIHAYKGNKFLLSYYSTYGICLIGSSECQVFEV